jgi:hypothetical protein
VSRSPRPRARSTTTAGRGWGAVWRVVGLTATTTPWTGSPSAPGPRSRVAG